MLKLEYGNRSVVDIIKARTSVRSYDGEPLDPDLKERLHQYSSQVRGPFVPEIRFNLIDTGSKAVSTDLRLGTYGVIRGANTFMAAALKEGDKNLENLGYVFEKVILYAAALDLGTCWLGGTFRKGAFAKAMKLQKDELLPIITPVGYAKDQRTVIDRLFRLSAGSNHRKPWEELFFDRQFGKSLAKEQAGIFEIPLEMVRLAPSASNRQPWRIIKEEESLHFYLQRSKGYAKSLGYDIQRVDMGIAMAHLELTLNELGMKGEWVDAAPASMDAPAQYVISWRTLQR